MDEIQQLQTTDKQTTNIIIIIIFYIFLWMGHDPTPPSHHAIENRTPKPQPDSNIPPKLPLHADPFASLSHREDQGNWNLRILTYYQGYYQYQYQYQYQRYYQCYYQCYYQYYELQNHYYRYIYYFYYSNFYVLRRQNTREI